VEPTVRISPAPPSSLRFSAFSKELHASQNELALFGKRGDLYSVARLAKTHLRIKFLVGLRVTRLGGEEVLVA
jgi:hypothetical protein